MMQQQTSPDLGTLTDQLALDNARVSKFVDSLFGQVDDLIDATMQSDWSEVTQLCKTMARTSAEHGYPIVSERAEQVCEAARKPQNELAIKRSIVKLIGSCGRARRPEQADRTGD